MTPRPTIALFVDERGGDWHARRLARSFEARGATVALGCLAACAFDTVSPSGLLLPGFDKSGRASHGERPGLATGALPHAAFVRSIGDGGLEQITFRLGILHALEASGVRVWNRPTAIERAVDKSSATFLFQRAGLPVPATVTVEGRARAATALARVGLPAVSKPMFGAQGAGIARVDGADGLPPAADVGDVYYMQRLIETAGNGQPGPANGAAMYGSHVYEDWRVLVSAGRVVSAMARRSSSWITNVHQGGTPSAVDPDPEMASLALRAAAAVGVDYGGVDLIRDSDGRLLVLEVNSNPAWRGLQSVTPFDIADMLAADLLAALGHEGANFGPSATARAAGHRALEPRPNGPRTRQPARDRSRE